MSALQAAWLNLIAAVILANIPFLRIFTIQRISTVWMDVILWIIGYLVWIPCSDFFETTVVSTSHKDWEVWGITIALFAVFAFPGLTWRYLLKT